MLWSVIRLICKTSSVTPDFFYVFNIILSFSTCSQSFKKICTWELLGANVLKRRVSFSMKGPKSPSDRFHNFLSLGWSQNSKHFYLFFDRLTNRIQSRSPQVRALIVCVLKVLLSKGVLIIYFNYLIISTQTFQSGILVKLKLHGANKQYKFLMFSSEASRKKIDQCVYV